MKKVVLLIFVLIGTMCIKAQEYCSFNANNAFGLDFENGTALAAGTVIGETTNIIATTGTDDIYKPQSVKATVGGIEISGGLQGSTNPKDADGGIPSATLVQPTIGSFIIFQAKANGYLYIVHKAVSHKAYTVFEDGRAISYNFAAIGNETTDLGVFYHFAVPYIVTDGQNAVQNPVEWAEREYLKASAPEKYAAHWSEDESGNQTWNRIAIVGAGVIKFPVRKGSKYIVNSNGTKITAGGFYFDTTGNADVKVDGLCILESDQKLPPPLPLQNYNPKKLTINVETAGTLPSLISADEKYQIEELTLTGELNGTDIHFIRDMAGVDMDRMEESELCVLCNETVFTKGVLRALDLSGANIVEGGRDYYKMLWSSSSRKYGDKQYTKANTISESMFVYCRPLVELILPRSVNSISPLLFSDNYGGGIYTNIKVLNVAEGNPYYESHNSCNAIIEKSTKTLIVGCQTTEIPDDVTSIGNDAFRSIVGLTSITIPSSVTSIGENAFNGCDLLFLTAEPTTPPSIAESAFPNCANATLYVPKGCKAAYEAADYWKDFKEIKEFAKDEEVTCVLEDDNTAIVTVANDPTEKDLVIPESVMIGEVSHPVTAIGEGAFKDNTELALVCIPETIEEIGNNAFAGCSGLTAIYSYSEEPIALDGGKATVRTRADGAEVSASTVFAEVDKNNCILYVPLNSADKYRTAEGWGEFENIVEMKSNKPGDANNDGEVDGKDVDATVGYIMEGKTDSFIFKNADVKADCKINAADIVKITNIITEKK